ncbi:hypothetical protein F0562_017718 [Nyssa sinensis]|uniref:Uncharacterized protein n=1 Tax=Nyssa sinensis TaxID=561372 RepID=A0A5J4ZFU3_9ASTE|nr:hypothetical protein F0562_017718 [Nyssa sinensis]
MIIREEGLLGLWAGASPTVMRNGINQAAMFTAKNTFDRILWKKQEGDGKVLQPWQSMISGFLAGTAGPVCTGPFDVVKTRLMAQSRSGGMLKSLAFMRGDICTMHLSSHPLIGYFYVQWCWKQHFDSEDGDATDLQSLKNWVWSIRHNEVLNASNGKFCMFIIN